MLTVRKPIEIYENHEQKRFHVMYAVLSIDQQVPINQFLCPQL